MLARARPFSLSAYHALHVRHARRLPGLAQPPLPPPPPPHLPRSRPTSTATRPALSARPAPVPPAPPALPIDSLPRYPTLTPLGALRALDYLGTLSFAHTGALLAAASGMDLLGTAVVGTVTAVGGGTIRDALILARRPFWTEETEYLYLSLAAAMATFALWPPSQPDDSVVHFATDAAGIAAFCVIGAQNGVRARMPFVVCVLCGMATATFGGAVRDVLVRREVRILHSHAEVYATTAAAGAVSYLVARRAGASLLPRLAAGLSVAFGARCWAWCFGTRLPVWQSHAETVHAACDAQPNSSLLPKATSTAE